MKKRYLIVMALLVAAVMASGCGKKEKEPVPATVTATPSPKANDNLVDMKKTDKDKEMLKNVMGTKTATSDSLILINNMGAEISSIYVRPNVEEEDSDDSWGDDLVQGKFVLKNGDKALYYYEKDQKDEDGNKVTSFDIQITFVDEDRNECFFRDLPLLSMKQIALCMDGRGENGIPYAKYLTATGTKPISTLKDVKERLGVSDEDSTGEEEDNENTETPNPTEPPESTETPDPTESPEPGPEEPGGDDQGNENQDPGAQHAAEYIGQSLDSLIGGCGSPLSSDYEEDPGTGTTGYHHYDTFTVSTTVDENGNEIVAAIW